MIFFVAVRHQAYAQPGFFPAGALVIDPFGIVPDQPGVDVVRIGRGPRR